MTDRLDAVVSPAEPQPVEHFSGGPEAFMRISAVAGDADGATGSMRTGPWLLGPDGRPAAGSLGVLTDDMFGFSALAYRPRGGWAVTTELTLDFGAPLPADGSTLTARSRAVHVDGTGGLGQGHVEDAHGRTVVTGTQRLRFAAGDPAEAAPSTSPTRVEDADTATMLELFGARVDDTGVELPTGAALGNPMGNLHGGIFVAVSEAAALLAVQTPDDPLRASSLTTVFLRPVALSGTITFDVETVHRGRTLAVVHVIARRPDGKPATVTTVTYQGC